MNMTAEARVLDIDGMTCDGCVQKVRTALGTVRGVTIDSVEVGHATIRCQEPSMCDSACKAVGLAGYEVRESASIVPGEKPASDAGASAASLTMMNEGGGSAPAAAAKM